VGGHGILYPPNWKVGGNDPVFPTKLRPCNQSWLWSRLQTTLAQIARIAPKWIYTVLDIFSPFTIFEPLALALQKQSCPEIFHCVEYTFYIQDIWATLCLPWKTKLPRNFSLYWIYILHSGFLTTCMRFPWKKEGALNSQYWLYISIIRDFWATWAFPEKRSCPGIFHCIEIFFIIQDFWATCACPEKQSCPDIFPVSKKYFSLFRSFK